MKDKKITIAPKRSIQKLRLLISIPAIIALLTIVMGLICYELVLLKLTAIADTNTESLILDKVLDNIQTAIISIGILSLFVGYGLARTIIAPIRLLKQSALSIGTGNLTHQVNIQTQDEIGELGESFNEMVQSLYKFTIDRNKFILESFTGGLITTDDKGYIAGINSSAAKLFKCNPDMVLNQSIMSLLPNNEKNAECLEVLKESIEKHKVIVNKETTLTNTDNETYPISLTTNLIKDVDKSIIGLIFNFRDLKEIMRFHEQMQRTDRLAAIGTFATGIAHEIRNPLGSIKGMAQLLKEDLKEDETKTKYLSVIIKEVNRLNKVVKELFDFSQPGESGIIKCDVNMLLSESLQLVKNNSSLENIKDMPIEEDYSLIPPLVLQPEKIMQAFLNLIQNAVQAAAPNGEIFIRSKVDEKRRRVVIEIENTNSTIPPELIEKIFDPFFTTKEEGIGLGLSITSQIIVNHKGTIEVKSKDNVTTFIVEFPIG